jgi:hypothetical protein
MDFSDNSVRRQELSLGYILKWILKIRCRGRNYSGAYQKDGGKTACYRFFKEFPENDLNKNEQEDGPQAGDKQIILKRYERFQKYSRKVKNKVPEKGILFPEVHGE